MKLNTLAGRPKTPEHRRNIAQAMRGKTHSAATKQKLRELHAGSGPLYKDGRYGDYPRYLYDCWSNMMQRCGNPNHPEYKNYGGRGIVVCPEWTDSKAFMDYVLAHLGPRDVGQSLDRTDNDGHYAPGNIRWASKAEQRWNSRR